MDRHALFYLAFAFLMGHELDAMTQQEWRLLPLLNLMDGEAARAAFVAIHVPAIFALLWWNGRGGAVFHAAFGGFCAIHAGVHWAFHGHPLYTFHRALSEAMIGGAGIVGAALAVLSLRRLHGA